MYWTWRYKDQEWASWGRPRSVDKNGISDIKPNYDIDVYQGGEIKRGDRVFFSMQGDATLGLGDSIWLISFIRELYSIKGRRRCQLDVATGKDVGKFFKMFLPKGVNIIPEYITKSEFDSYDHKLPAMYYWRDDDDSDRSWIDNQSIVERLYHLCGMKYDSLPDFGDFTDPEVLYPPKNYYERLGIDPKDKYVFFQWHTSSGVKNLPAEVNIKLLKHITREYGYKVYVIGRLDGLDSIEKIPGVVNLSNNTTGADVISLGFGCEFFVSPDSAGVHLSEAFRIPGVGILGTLTPSYIASKYRIPTFMFGAGHCSHRPCGVVKRLPLERCPVGTKTHCAVLGSIDLKLFDKCVTQSFRNRELYRSCDPTPFYDSDSQPITLNKY